MVILGLDTSSALTSVGIVDGESVLAELGELDARRHAEVMAPMVRSAMRQAAVSPEDVDVIACGVGPGAYTGLRVAIATGRALGLVWDRPVVGLCSLDAVAALAFDAVELEGNNEVCVGVDARRRELYWASYSRAHGRQTGPWVMRPADIAAQFHDCPWVVASDHPLDLPVVREARPSGAWVARVVGRHIAAGQTVATPQLELSEHGDDGAATAAALDGLGLLPPEPLYLRRPDAATPVVQP